MSDKNVIIACFGCMRSDRIFYCRSKLIILVLYFEVKTFRVLSVIHGMSAKGVSYYLP